MDWKFDVGFDAFGNFYIDAHASSVIKTRILTAITREELKDIRRTITHALLVWKQGKAP